MFSKGLFAIEIIPEVLLIKLHLSHMSTESNLVDEALIHSAAPKREQSSPKNDVCYASFNRYDQETGFSGDKLENINEKSRMQCFSCEQNMIKLMIIDPRLRL